jgi:hypothetical protein
MDWSFALPGGGEVAYGFSQLNDYEETYVPFLQWVQEPTIATNPGQWRGKIMVRASTPLQFYISGDVEAINLLISGYLLQGDTAFPEIE